MYLKRFSSNPGMICRYDLLVPNEQVPDWVEKPLDRVASHEHLYTSLEGQKEVDQHERWIGEEFETPAEDAIDRAVTGRRLRKEHWLRLILFLAAQDVRTPARLHERLEHWKKELPAMMDETLKESVSEIVQAKREGRKPKRAIGTAPKGFPMRVRIEPSDDPGQALLSLQTTIGRSMWLWAQRHLLMGIAARLLDHRWTILTAPDEVTWWTTDDPVIRLNYYSETNYTFGGGWGSPGTEIFMPLDPGHLLYTSIGSSRMIRGTELTNRLANDFRRFIAEHASRHIFSSRRDLDVAFIRPRRVNLQDFLHEKEQWKQWPKNQADAEIELST
jgi:hypothetical protein